MPRRLVIAFFATIAALAIPGCHRPAGAIMPYTGGSSTYFSYETRPVTVTILDLRTNEEIFTINVPPGKQLTFDFKPGEGDDEIYTPDVMRYEIFDMGTETGSLENILNVPPANARRVDVYYRDEFEYREAKAGDQLRPEQLVNDPARWSPRHSLPQNRVANVPTDR